MRQVVVVLLLSACAAKSPDTPLPLPPSGTPVAPSGPTADKLASGGDCANAPSGAVGVVHASNIAGTEIWKAADNPHRVTSSIRIDGTLTIEACVTVLMAPGATIDVGSSASSGAKLMAQGIYVEGVAGSSGVSGETLRPVIFRSEDDTKHWGSLRVWDKNTAELSSTVLAFGGDVEGSAYFDYGGTLVLRGPNDSTLGASTKVDLVLVLNSGGMGVVMENGAGFTANSRNLFVIGAGQQPSNSVFPWHYPVYVQAPGVATLPSGGIYSGSAMEKPTAADKILVDGSKGISVSEAFYDRGVPYLMQEHFYMRPASTATFHVDAGVTLEFVKGAHGLELGDTGGGQSRNVTIDIVGTAAKPIVFTSAEAAPAPGDWMGFYLNGSPANGNKIEYATIAYAGGESGTNSFGCGPKDNDAAMIITEWAPADAFVKNVAFKFSAGGGIVSGWVTNADGPNLKVGNTFEGIGNGCDVSKWRLDAVNYCPDGPDVCL